MNHIKLEELRNELGLSKKDIAEIFKISDSLYGRWENEKADIPTRRIIQLANFFMVNVDYLLGLTTKRRKIKYDNKLDIEVISQRCREVRNDYNESLRVFSKRFNTTSSTWYAYENGDTFILGSFLLDLCRNGNYSAEWILGKSNTKRIN